MQTRIGIDPDIQASGIAIMEDGELISLGKKSFTDLIELIDDNLDAIYSVEHVELIKPTWPRLLRGTTADQKKRIMSKISQDVGLVKGAGRLIGQVLTWRKCTFELITPLKGHIKLAKTNSKLFNQIMHWSGRSNNDNRDAALLLHLYLK